MGTLKVKQIDLNDVAMVNKIRSTVRRLINTQSSYHPLEFNHPHYFKTPNVTFPSERGWYIILHGMLPIYVGKADDLNERLNTENGSRDNFANPERRSDPERNFIKKFAELNVLNNLRVCIIEEKKLCSELGFYPNDLTPLDRGNVEKLINIFRCLFLERRHDGTGV